MIIMVHNIPQNPILIINAPIVSSSRSSRLWTLAKRLASLPKPSVRWTGSSRKDRRGRGGGGGAWHKGVVGALRLGYFAGFRIVGYHIVC